MFWTPLPDSYNLVIITVLAASRCSDGAMEGVDAEQYDERGRTTTNPRDLALSSRHPLASLATSQTPPLDHKDDKVATDAESAILVVDAAESIESDDLSKSIDQVYEALREDDFTEGFDLDELDEKIRTLVGDSPKRTNSSIRIEPPLTTPRVGTSIASADGADMNQYSPYHDPPNSMQSPNTNYGRNPQSPVSQVQAQQQAQVNGIGGNAHGGVPQGNQTGMPNGVLHPGQQIDINYLWGVVEELSEALAQNRAQTASIIGSVQRMQSRPNNDDTHARDSEQDPNSNNNNSNGDASSTVNHAAEIASLRTEIHNLTKQLQTQESENTALQSLVGDYESALQNLMPKLRKYAHDHTVNHAALHKYYNALLESEREANLQLRLEHGEWQAGLGRACDWARKALREQSDGDSARLAREAELKYENRVLRRLVGWEVEEDSDDERERAAEDELKRKAAEADAQRAAEIEAQGIPGM